MTFKHDVYQEVVGQVGLRIAQAGGLEDWNEIARNIKEERKTRRGHCHRKQGRTVRLQGCLSPGVKCSSRILKVIRGKKHECRVTGNFST